MKSIIAMCLLVAALAGCTSQNTLTGLNVSGQTLLATVNAHNSMALNVYFPNCQPVALGYDKFCGAFKKFSPQFVIAFDDAFQAWQTAVKANDTAKAKGAEATVIQLSTELAALAATIILQEVR